ncbi:NAD(P)H-dependent oxidoreductase [Nonomuraea spiralis]|uniref:NAD(P)H-dependent oxidoreductase n=1 Tax=Nonomuraea spiralis TaxID=46182 RepID=UPI003798EACF
MEPVNVAIIYYSATGTVHALAEAAAEGAEKAGARVRLRRVAETAPPEAIEANPAWGRHLRDTDGVAVAGLDDLSWADAVLFGTPSRFGNPAGQLRAFIVPPGYTDPVQFRSGNPYGTSHVDGDGAPGDVSLEAARHQARRVAETAAALKAGRAA